jgi:hypothetical protein
MVKQLGRSQIASLINLADNEGHWSNFWDHTPAATVSFFSFFFFFMKPFFYSLGFQFWQEQRKNWLNQGDVNCYHFPTSSFPALLRDEAFFLPLSSRIKVTAFLSIKFLILIKNFTRAFSKNKLRILFRRLNPKVEMKMFF